MAISQKRSKRKPSGARYKSTYKEKLHELGSDPAFTKLEPRRRRTVRVLGGNKKMKFFSTDTVNILDPKTKKYSVVKMKTVVENSANRNYIRRNILTKGAIVETELGKAKITSRPGQEGTLNAVLVSE